MSSTFTPFDDLKVSLITYVVNAKGNYDRETIFETFPIKLLPKNEKKRETKKNKPPFIPNSAGSIISLVFGDSFRGIQRSPFKNTTSITMCLAERNMSVFIFDSETDSTNFRFAGAKKVEHVHECLGFISKYLVEVQEMLDYIQANNDIYLKVIKWMKETIEDKDNKLKPLPTIPDDIDKKIATYLLSFYPEFSAWSDYETVINWIGNVERVVSPGFEKINVNSIISTMTNYNYSLGFTVNRPVLAKLAAKTKFTPIFDNTSKQPSVKLELVYQRDESFSGIRKKKESKHTIQIHRSGNTTQSGPSSALMKPVYEYFMTFIMEVRHLINNDLTEGDKAELNNLTDSNLTESIDTAEEDMGEEEDGEEIIG